MYAKVGSRYETRARQRPVALPRAHAVSRHRAAARRRSRSTTPSRRSAARSTPRPAATTRCTRSRCIPRRCATGIELFGEIFATPAFSDIELERRIVLEEMQRGPTTRTGAASTSTTSRAAVAFGRITRSASASPGPTRTSSASTTPTCAATSPRSTARATWCCASSGAVEHDEVVDGVRARVRARCRRARRARSAPPPESQTAPRFVLRARRGLADLSVQILFRAVPRDRPRLPGAARARRASSTTACRRGCTTALVDELGLAYYVSASLEPFADAGAVRDRRRLRARERARRWSTRRSASRAAARRAAVATTELDKAQAPLPLGPRAQLRRPDAMAGWWGGTELFFGPTVDGRQARARQQGHARVGAARRAADFAPRAAHRRLRRHADQEARARSERRRRRVRLARRMINNEIKRSGGKLQKNEQRDREIERNDLTEDADLALVCRFFPLRHFLLIS